MTMNRISEVSCEEYYTHTEMELDNMYPNGWTYNEYERSEESDKNQSNAESSEN